MCVAEDITHVGHCQEHTRHHVADALALGAFRVVGQPQTHLGTRRGAEGKGDTYEQDREAGHTCQGRSHGTVPQAVQGTGQGVILCTLRSGLLPASLASAACCPLLRGTLEGAGASCALTGTRETGWSAARSAKARGFGERVPLEYGSSACCTARERDRSGSSMTLAAAEQDT